MAKAALCPECGIPGHIYRQIIWRENGTMAQRRNPDHRSVFIECENIDGVFREIEDIIGHSIEHIIVESRSRSSADYLEHILPAAAIRLMRLTRLKPVMRRVSNVGRALGYGDLELTGLRWKGRGDDFIVIRARDPYSLPLLCGDIAGTIGVFDGRSAGITCRQTGPLEYELRSAFSPRAPELRERLAWRRYEYKEGDIELERCSYCGAPRALQDYGFDLEKGVIISRSTGRRMVGVGPAALEAIFDELEKEVGDSIPRVVIEAQRRFVLGGFYTRGEIARRGDMRMQFAIRGLGNLKELHFSREGLRCRMENPCLHLIFIGTLQGFYELVFGQPGEVDWRFREDGDLLVVVSPGSAAPGPIPRED